jgi:hypothetical protein
MFNSLEDMECWNDGIKNLTTPASAFYSYKNERRIIHKSAEKKRDFSRRQPDWSPEAILSFWMR